MHLVPIPVTPEHLRQTEPIWFPFLGRISGRSGEPVASLYDRIMRGEVQPILVWDGPPETFPRDIWRTRALCGVRFYMRDSEKVAQWVWMTGAGRKDWEHLILDMEKFMSDVGTILSEAVCRKGWMKILRKYGYQLVGYRDGHALMEKRL